MAGRIHNGTPGTSLGLEATVAEYPAQAKLLSAVVKGPCFKADELPPVPDEARKPPSRPKGKGLYHETEDNSQ